MYYSSGPEVRSPEAGAGADEPGPDELQLDEIYSSSMSRLFDLSGDGEFEKAYMLV